MCLNVRKKTMDDLRNENHKWKENIGKEEISENWKKLKRKI